MPSAFCNEVSLDTKINSDLGIIGMLSTFLRASAIGVALTYGISASAQSGNDQLDSIVAVVNEEVVLSSELADELRSVRDQLRQSNTRLPSDAVLAKQVLERVVMMRLQTQTAKRNGIRVDDRQLNAALEDIASQNKMNLRQFRDAVEADGYDFPGFRERIRSEIIINRARQRLVTNRITVPEREITRYLANKSATSRQDDQVNVAQILFEVSDGASADEIARAKARGEEVLAKLSAGESFGGLAVAYSDGQNALDGGSLGWRKTSELPLVFSDAIAGLGAGESSGVVRTSSGFHIVRLVERKTDQRHLVQQTRARHILLRPGELANEKEVIARLRNLRERIANGEDFGALARAHSDDRGSALREGDLGWVNPGDTVPAFERQMDILDEGDVSEEFRSQFGWHIVQVIERRSHDSTDVVRRTAAREAIMGRKRDEELQNWLRQLRDEAYVEIRLQQ
jgi:peptidyl-prolyl cis-trans isomerase SurA